MSSRMVRVVNVMLVLVFLGLCVACGGVQQAAARSKRMNEMKQLGLLYFNFSESHGGQPPKDIEEFQQAAAGDPDAMSVLNLIKSGQITFLYGARMQDMTQGTSNTILAHEATVPANGGIVLMADGSVKQMTAAEFQAAPKAQPKK